MNVVCFATLLAVYGVIHGCECSRILAWCVTPSYSHELAYRKIWETLAARGHEVVLMTTAPKFDKNYPTLREIDLSFSHKIDKEHDISNMKFKNSENILKMTLKYLESRNQIIEMQLQHPEVAKILRNESGQFDAFILEILNPIADGLVHKLKGVPFIGVLSNEVTHYTRKAMGEPYNPLIYNDAVTGLSKTFLDRVKIFVKLVAFDMFIRLTMPSVESVKKKYYGEDCPDYAELAKKLDLVIENSNMALHPVKPYVDSHVRVSGLNIQPPKPLEQNMQNYLDSSKNGVIYFSLGTSVKSKDLSNKTLEVIKETFKDLPYDILWKFELPTLEGKPDNAKIVQWTQQQDILRHPNVKLFIMQGGIQSIEEAFYSFKPMLVLPVAGDQGYNADLVVDRGYGLKLNIKNLENSEFKEAIEELITNETYKNRIKEMAMLSLDEPMTSIDRAIWWIEYVIRNKGAQHLKGPGINMPMYQYLFIDVIAFCAVVFSVSIFIIYTLLKFICNLIKSKLSISKSNKVKNKTN